MPKGSSSKATTSRGSNNNASVSSFESFFEGWLVRQEHYLDELISARDNLSNSREDDLKDLITKVLSHYQQYYDEKSRLAQRDVFILFCPPWFTSLELSFFWIAGFKPGLIIRIVHDKINDLTERQRAELRSLKDETRAEERRLNDEMARVEESVAGAPLMELARERGRGGAVPPPEGLKTELRSVVASADWLRTRTVIKVEDILNPVQNVKFLTEASQLLLRVRSCGFEKEAERQGRGD